MGGCYHFATICYRENGSFVHALYPNFASASLMA
jgi:hypothetical protein